MVVEKPTPIVTNHRERGNVPLPSILLRDVSLRLPGIWQMYDRFRQDRGNGVTPNWPDWCYCPSSATFALMGGDKLIGNPEATADAGLIIALAAWRVSQGIYRFDPALAADIITTPITALPSDVLFRLPEWCVYIEADGVDGFFAYLDWSLADEKTELHLLSPATGHPIHLDLSQPTLDLAIQSALDDTKRIAPILGIDVSGMPANLSRIQKAVGTPMLNLVLYLCAANADLGGERPEQPRPVKTKKGWKMFPPDKPRIWDVGCRIGAALRAAHLSEQTEQQAGLTETGRHSPRAHVRRAHWHTYRIGEGRKDSILKWLPPIPINIDEGELVPVVRKIKK